MYETRGRIENLIESETTKGNGARRRTRGGTKKCDISIIPKSCQYSFTFRVKFLMGPRNVTFCNSAVSFFISKKSQDHFLLMTKERLQKMKKGHFVPAFILIVDFSMLPLRFRKYA